MWLVFKGFVDNEKCTEAITVCTGGRVNTMVAAPGVFFTNAEIEQVSHTHTHYTAIRLLKSIQTM